MQQFMEFFLNNSTNFGKIVESNKSSKFGFCFLCKIQMKFYLQGASFLCILLKTKFARITEQTPAVSLPIITGTR